METLETNDLFTGEPVQIPVKARRRTKCEIFHDEAGYKTVAPTCSSCDQMLQFQGRFKCLRVGVDSSAATDIEVGGVCRFHPELRAMLRGRRKV